ncbi:MAG: hypothetical protein EAZ73_14070 [Oscillatoriales cyanobacterium]|nr:MAG: hypothetical protein EAZ73_14070 [Oscillatoriales cyanobacterium]
MLKFNFFWTPVQLYSKAKGFVQKVRSAVGKQRVRFARAQPTKLIYELIYTNLLLEYEFKYPSENMEIQGQKKV